MIIYIVCINIKYWLEKYWIILLLKVMFWLFVWNVLMLRLLVVMFYIIGVDKCFFFNLLNWCRYVGKYVGIGVMLVLINKNGMMN